MPLEARGGPEGARAARAAEEGEGDRLALEPRDEACPPPPPLPY
jgi:hypothetical protein